MRVIFSDGETEVVEDEDDICLNLEFLDTDDPVDPVKVVDGMGRPVRLKVEALQILRLELIATTQAALELARPEQVLRSAPGRAARFFEPLVRCTRPGELGRIHEILHDRWFDLEDVSFDDAAGTLQIRFPLGESERFLRIHHVRGWHCEDTEEVGRYDLNEIRYFEPDQRVDITTGVPLSLSARVDAFEISLEASALTPFQRECLARVEEWLDRRRLEVGFRFEVGQHESFVRGAFDHAGSRFELFIYEDEAGFGRDGEWYICERPDFDTDGELVEELLVALSR